MAVQPLPTTLLNDRIPDWWRPLTVDLGGERIARARLNAETLRHELSLGNAVDAVAYAYGDSEAGERIIDTVRVAARGAENGTPAAVGDAEPPALVAAALADQLAVEPDTEVSTLISLLVLSAHWSGRRPAIEGMRLSDYADRQLEYRSASSRRMTQLSSAPSTSEFVREAMRSLGAAVQDVPGSTLSRRDSKVTTQADIMIALAARIDELAARTDYEHAILREQMRQQTWMQQTWCETAEADWSEVVPEARPIIAAIELAQRTRGATPAVSAEALLGSVLQSDGRGWGIDPAAAVAAAGPYIADRWRVAPHPFLFPLAAELSRWRERKADRDEPEGWRLSPDRAAEDRLAEDRQDENVLSLQAYREALALRLLGYD
jgi:hypothetical protein